MVDDLVHYAINWPLAAAGDLYQTGENAIPIPFIRQVTGTILGTVTAIILFLFVGWVRGVFNYDRSV